MSSFSIPLSGLASSSQALNIISNNLANLNTVGFKDQQANFQDLFYQNFGTNGAGNPIQGGMGTKIGSVTTQFSDGAAQLTNIPSNAAITGNGFFITQSASGALSYTRAGDFSVNTQGQLVTSTGDLVLGYPSALGVVNTGAPLGPLQVGLGLVGAPNATTTMQQETNLDASAPVGTTYQNPMAVYDSLGDQHILTYSYTKTAVNTWSYQITLPAADTGGTGAPTVLGSGSLVFDGNGNLTSPVGSVPGINVTGLADGAAPMSMTWNLASSTGASLMTQVASQSTTATSNQDGYASGTLERFVIGSDGVINGTFTNGQTQALGEFALATFGNTQGLQAIGANEYTPTLASGAAVVGLPNAGGRGVLTGGAQEMSNVDISTEFTRLIVTQRGFQADARLITTFDSIGNTTTNLQAQPGN